jgi:Calcineurin-like phosphoesterase
MAFDIIGDIHGQYDKLVTLLRHLGYSESAGTWRHSDRSAVFLGDLIDRGPKQLATIDLVRRMVDSGAGRCIMGNHEFNAIAWVTPDPEHSGKFLRDHHKPGNREQHQAFLDVVEGTHLQREITDWFRTLPLWMDVGGLRVVHACWHQPSIDLLKKAMGSGQRLTDEIILLGSRKGDPMYEAIETICKGPEVELPPGITFKDKDGKVRNEVRVKWWQEDLSTYRKAAQGPPEEVEKVPDVPLPAEWLREFRGLPQDVATRGAREASRSHISESPLSSERRDARTARLDGECPPVVFGHYWFTGKPEVISPRFACLDYSAARDGPLVAYRWDGEAELTSDKLAWV